MSDDLKDRMHEAEILLLQSHVKLEALKTEAMAAARDFDFCQTMYANLRIQFLQRGDS